MSTADAVQKISDWLIEQGLSDGSYEDLLAGFCERLNEAGIHVERSMLAMRTLHPTIDARGFIWRRGEDMDMDNFTTDRGPTQAFRDSPLAYLLENREVMEIRRPLTGPADAFDFPILHDLKEQGITDYIIRKVPFPVATLQGYESGMLISWASDAPDGFTETCLTALRRLAPRLALAMNNRLLREITINVLDTYVGHQAGERILKGEISRGSLQDIDAAILFMDLRGFTALADRSEGAVMAELLNDYFERIVPPVLDRGGEILKYMGDGVLATFSLKDLSDDMVCMTALNAAIEALENVEAWNADRSAAGDPVMALDIAVHLGRVQFGNVGAGNRLDFTVIGAAVNEASRIEALCDDLDRHLVISEKFADAATHCTERLMSLGRHGLRGVSRDQELFTVDYGAPGMS
jgi:adenylate cyclase